MASAFTNMANTMASTFQHPSTPTKLPSVTSGISPGKRIDLQEKLLKCYTKCPSVALLTVSSLNNAVIVF